jgi:hypothetical protein
LKGSIKQLPLSNQLKVKTTFSMMEESQELKEKLRKSSDDNDLLENENNSLKNEITRTAVHTAEVINLMNKKHFPKLF